MHNRFKNKNDVACLDCVNYFNQSYLSENNV